MILDHKDGNCNNNETYNLRYLCPNCNSQLPTAGGRNIGRIVNQSNRGYEVKNAIGKTDKNVVSQPMNLKRDAIKVKKRK